MNFANQQTAPQGQPPHIPGFDNNTRLRRKLYGAITRPTGGGLSFPIFQVNKVGLLKGIYLNITGTIATATGTLNALGKCAIIKRVRVYLNNGNTLFSVSGPGYHWILRDQLDGYYNPFPGSDARSAVATGAFDISMYIPIMLNERDAVGLVLLQNDATVVTVEVEWESDANIAATTLTFTGTPTAVPTLEFFQVPQDANDFPDIVTFHSIIEDQIVVSQTSGDYQYPWLKGNTYLQMLHGYGIGVAGADNWSKAILRANQTDTIYEDTPPYQNFLWADNHPTTRPAGVFTFDLLGSSGIGAFGASRDEIDSANAADIYSVVTVTAAGTLYAIRRMLIPAQY